MHSSIIIIGYSGHAFVVIDILEKAGNNVTAYCEKEEKINNPYKLSYLGSEKDPALLSKLKSGHYFIAVGSNSIRSKIQQGLLEQQINPRINAVHPSSVITRKIEMGYGIMIGANVSINPLSQIGNGAICNTGCIIEHENQIGDYAHIGPGVVLCGNVKIGRKTFVGANSVIKEGISVGDNVIIGAGSVIIRNVPDNVMIIGNPGKIIRHLL